MTPQHSAERQRALTRPPNEPLEIDDRKTHDSEPGPRAFYRAFEQAVKDDLDAPGMEEYDNYDPPQHGS